MLQTEKSRLVTRIHTKPPFCSNLSMQGHLGYYIQSSFHTQSSSHTQILVCVCVIWLSVRQTSHRSVLDFHHCGVSPTLNSLSNSLTNILTRSDKEGASIGLYWAELEIFYPHFMENKQGHLWQGKWREKLSRMQQADVNCSAKLSNIKQVTTADAEAMIGALTVVT